MPAVNRVILIGNITRDPVLRYTPKGTACCELGMAINRKFKTDSGPKEEVTFVDITFWGVQADTINKWVSKGDPLYVEGRLQLDTWDDKNSGQKRSKLRIIGEAFQFLGSSKGQGQQQQQQQQRPIPEPTGPLVDANPNPFGDDEDDPLPM